MAKQVRKDLNIDNDIEEIFQYIARDNPRAALMVVEAIADTLKDIEEFPEIGRPIELKTKLVVRRRQVPGYRSFSIYYSLSEAELRFLYVHHAARDGRVLNNRITTNDGL